LYEDCTTGHLTACASGAEMTAGGLAWSIIIAVLAGDEITSDSTEHLTVSSTLLVALLVTKVAF